jgi:predicted component of type VI protein secretion system
MGEEEVVESERRLEDGTLVIGRAADCDWILDDTARLLSRHHCEVTMSGGRLFVTDLSANGLFLNGAGQRLERGVPMALGHGDRLQVGEYELSVQFEAKEIPHDPFEEDDGGSPGEGLAAFLDGAELPATTMSGADPGTVLRRAGRLYRQIITHVYELLRDRSAVKAQFRAEQTMVMGAGNTNPFKALLPEELAVRLLRSDQKGYLASEEAVEATFRDVKRHQLAVLAGMHRALVGLVSRLDPDEIEEALGKRSTMSIVTSGGKKAAAWDTYRAYFEQLEKDIADLDRSSFMADFRRGYEDRLRQLQNADL